MRRGSDSNSRPNNSAECVICCSPIDVFAVGPCAHRGVCGLCSLRARLLFNDLKCPLCKADQAPVLYISSKQTIAFETVERSSLIYNDTLSAYFENSDYETAVLRLQQWQCGQCFQPEIQEGGRVPLSAKGSYENQRHVRGVFNSSEKLKRHARDKHGKMFCEICLRDRKVFSFEMRLYSDEELVTHHKHGDSATEKDDPIAPHPQCRFCRTNLFFDDDALKEHMSKNHFNCFLCQRRLAPGELESEYFRSYGALQHHFRHKHYPCAEAGCLEKKFVVFETALDLQAHSLKVHLNTAKMSRLEQKSARQIQVNFNYGERRERNTTRGGLTPEVSPYRHGRGDASHNTAFSSIDSNRTTSPFNTKPDSLASIFAKAEALMSLDVTRLSQDELKQRNRDLIAEIRRALGNDGQKFDTFKAISQQFRAGMISSELYFDRFMELFTVTQAAAASIQLSEYALLFVKLLSLLPDMEKRQQLYLVFRRRIAVHENNTDATKSKLPAKGKIPKGPKPEDMESQQGSKQNTSYHRGKRESKLENLKAKTRERFSEKSSRTVPIDGSVRKPVESPMQVLKNAGKEGRAGKHDDVSGPMEGKFMKEMGNIECKGPTDAKATAHIGSVSFPVEEVHVLDRQERISQPLPFSDVIAFWNAVMRILGRLLVRLYADASQPPEAFRIEEAHELELEQRLKNIPQSYFVSGQWINAMLSPSSLSSQWNPSLALSSEVSAEKLQLFLQNAASTSGRTTFVTHSTELDNLYNSKLMTARDVFLLRKALRLACDFLEKAKDGPEDFAGSHGNSKTRHSGFAASSKLRKPPGL